MTDSGELLAGALRADGRLVRFRRGQAIFTQGDRAERVFVIERGWEVSANFELYEDALPVLDELRAHGLKLGLVSNGIRDLTEFVAHHGLDVDAIVDSRTHGYVKPHPTIFQAALDLLGVRAEDAAMVGDSLAEDVDGARALGMRGILVDREHRYPEVDERLIDLYGLPAALGLPRPGDLR